MNSRLAWLTILAIEILVLGARTPGLQNSSLLVDSGSALIHRQNPYTDWNAYGPIPAVPYWLVSKLVPIEFASTLFMALNVLGVGLCLSYFVKIEIYKVLIVMVLVLATGPFRALFASVQHTGVILGCLTLGTIIIRRRDSSKISFLNVWAGFFLFSMAYDLKPHIALPFLLLFLFSMKKFWSILHFGIFYLALRVTLDLWNGRFLEKLQFEKWRAWRTDPLTVKEQISPWKLISFFGIDSQYVFIFSFVVYFSILILIIFRYSLNPRPKYFVYALLLPSITAYLHLYDLVLLVSLIACQLIYLHYKALIPYAFSLLFFPTHYSPNQIYLLLGSILALFFVKKQFHPMKKALPNLFVIVEVFLGALTSIVISLVPISVESKVAWQLMLCYLCLYFAYRKRGDGNLLARFE